jgi:hypothetical protein
MINPEQVMERFLRPSNCSLRKPLFHKRSTIQIFKNLDPHLVRKAKTIGDSVG